MALADGDPASDADVWLRVITDENYWRKDGTLHNTAFGGKAFSASAGRPWAHELSGRLLFLIATLQDDCVAFCGNRFAGLMYQKVENLRSEGSGFPTGVYYTPKTADNAHSDFVSFGTTSTKADMYALRDWLQDFIQHVRPTSLAAVEALRHGP